MPGLQSHCHLQSSFLLMPILGGQQRWFKHLSPCHPPGTPRWSFRFLTLDWPHTYDCRPSPPPIYLPPTFLSHCLSNIYILLSAHLRCSTAHSLRNSALWILVNLSFSPPHLPASSYPQPPPSTNTFVFIIPLQFGPGLCSQAGKSHEWHRIFNVGGSFQNFMIHNMEKKSTMLRFQILCTTISLSSHFILA